MALTAVAGTNRRAYLNVEKSEPLNTLFWTRERFNNIDTIDVALCKIKYRGDQKLSHFFIMEEDIGKI